MRLLAAALLVSLTLVPASAQCVNLGSGYSQDFNSLASSGTGNTWTDNATIPGWYSNRTTYNAGTGSSNAGALYSFGTAASDRALGSVASGSTNTVYYGVCLTNNTATAVGALSIAFTGEQWRTGGSSTSSPSVAQTLDFQYQVGASSLITGTWTDHNPGDFTSPIFGVAAAALDGNAAANRQAISFTLTVAIPAGGTIWLRWSDPNDPNNDHGLAIDDFSVSAGSAPTPPTATGSASPAAAAAGSTVALNATATPGTNPASTGLAVACNLSAIGGSSTFALAAAGGNAFSSNYALPAGATPGGYTLPCTVSDAESRSSGFNIALTVTPPPVVCGAVGLTPINSIQGSGATSPMVGNTVEVEGVVTGDYQLSTQLKGFYLQSADAERDANDATSEGIFVYDNLFGVDVSPGQRVRVRGVVAEFNSSGSLLTELGTVSSVAVCGAGGAVTPVDINFPVSDLERYEGMLVRFPQQLTVAANYELGQYGTLILSLGRLTQPTQAALPGAAAVAVVQANSQRKIFLDDGSTASDPYPTLYPAGGLSAANTLRSGQQIAANWVGILDQRYGTYRVQPFSALTCVTPSANPRPAALPSVPGRLRIAGMNVLNYFTTLGSRGAATAAEFDRQRAKLVAAIIGFNPDILAVTEVENNGTLPGSAIDNLVQALNAAAGAGVYAAINSGTSGTDAIMNGFLYKTAAVTPVGGPAQKVNDPATNFGNRPSIAQTFKPFNGAKTAIQHFTVVVNHLRSKGCSSSSTGPNADQGDGQGCNNQNRASFAAAIRDWLATNPTSDPTPAASRRFLLLGDFNAYLNEDPITAFTSNGYRHLVQLIRGAGAYSYSYSGEYGYLDHAIASPAAERLVRSLTEWHVNADEPLALEYEFGSKSPAAQTAYYAPDQFRSSDHDPIVLGFNPLPGDLDDDGDVDNNDQLLLRANFNKTAAAAADRRMDYDGDGMITLNDYRVWYTFYQAFLK